MAAPNSSPDLSVVSEQEAESSASPASAAQAPPPAAAQPAPARTEEKRRRGVPWWVVAVVAVAGLVLFVTQYQRAQRLDARVQGLQAELAVAGEQLAAYQSHLTTVRGSVGELSDRVAGLKTLVDMDPLNPPPAPVVEAAETAESAPAEEAVVAPETESSAAQSTEVSPEPFLAEPVLVDEGAPATLGPVVGDSREILDGALSMPFEPERF